MTVSEEKRHRVHNCKEQDSTNPPFTVENRGDGWYLYSGDSRGKKSINFCPSCGTKLEVDK